MISTKGRYALKVMIDLAEHSTGNYTPLNEIAERQGISMKYLEIILRTLVKAKLLEGQRGKGGGYRLTRPAKDYPVGEILELSEGTLSSVSCLAAGTDSCPKEDSCQTLPLWKRFNKMVHDFFYGVTLDDLVKEKLETTLKNAT